MIKEIPSLEEPTLQQVNKGENSGNIWASWNMDFLSNPPLLRISPKTKAIVTTTDIATLISPVAFIRTAARGTDEWWAVCNQKLLYSNGSTDPTGSWIADATASSPTTALDSLYSDAVEFDGNLIVSLKTDIARLVAGTWTAAWWTSTIGGAALTTAIPHPLCVTFNNLLLIGNGNVVASINISNSFNNTRLTFPSEYQVEWIRSSNTEIWIGCSNKKNRRAKVFKWDGAAESYTGDYKVGATKVYSCVIKNDIPFIINGNGQLMNFNGAGFSEIARLPIADNKYYPWFINQTTPPVHQNGMTLIDERINILLNGGLNSNQNLLENMNSGIWCYTPENGLHHRYSMNNTLGTAKDYGSPIVRNVGALAETEKLYGSFLAGFRVSTDNDSALISTISNLDTWNGANITDNTLKIGYYVTPKFLTHEVQEMWQRVWLLYSKNLNSTDSIVVKYRTSKVNYSSNFKKSSSWASDTTFTSASSQVWSDVSVGDEVEILSGMGAGLQAKITDITLFTTTYTITIDQSITGASGNLYVRVGNWTQIGTVTDQITTNKEFAIMQNSNWVQFKVILSGKGDSPEIERLIASSAPQLKPV